MGGARAWLGFGLVAGFLLGLGIGSDPPITKGGGSIFLLVPLEALALLSLGVLALALRRPGPAVAAAGVFVASLVGAEVAPEPVGTWHEQPGTATVGTPADPEAWWAGGVTCSWEHGDPTVSWVVFEGPPPDAPAGLVGPPASDLERDYPAVLGQLRLRGSAPGRASISWEHGGYGGDERQAEVDALDLAGNGQSGTADLGVDGLVISWSCEGGP